MLIHGYGAVRDLYAAYVAISLLEEVAGVEEGVEVAEAEVGGGAMAPERVEVAAADEDQLRHAEGGGATGQSADVVPLRYVVHHHVALHHRHFSSN